jgi:hypothetical protein
LARRRARWGDVDAGAVEHAALGAEVVLHVHDQDGAAAGVDPHRLRPGVEGDQAVF